MKPIIKFLDNIERKYWPQTRRKKSYKTIKALILTIILFIPAMIIKFAEYVINLVRVKIRNRPKIKLQNIVDGWYNLAVSDPVVERVAMERANICATCPFAEMSSGVHTIVKDNKTTHIRGLKCTKCGCPLSAKVRSSKDYCPIGKW